MPVVKFSSQAQSLSVRLHAQGKEPGQAHYSCWLESKGPTPRKPDDAFLDLPGDPERTVPLPGNAASHDSETLSVKVSYAGTTGDTMHLYFDILEDPGGQRIGGFGDGTKPGHDVTIKGSEDEDYYDQFYFLLRRA